MQAVDLLDELNAGIRDNEIQRDEFNHARGHNYDSAVQLVLVTIIT